MIPLKATEGRLIVKVIKKDTEGRSSGGIMLAQPINQSLCKGIVINLGPVKKDISTNYNVGDTVYWQDNFGVDYDYEGEDYKILNQYDIIAFEHE